MRVYLLFGAFLLSAVLAGLNFWALNDFLYFKYDWFDTPMHFLGGITVGVFLVGFLYRFTPRLYVVALAVIFIGWEVFEYYSGIPRKSNYVFDTSLDLLMDALGAVIVYVVARKTLWHSK